MAPKEKPAAPAAADQVQLETLPPQQLMELREGINNDIQRMGEGIQTLSRATGTFANTKRAVEELGASEEGKIWVRTARPSITQRVRAGGRACCQA